MSNLSFVCFTSQILNPLIKISDFVTGNNIKFP